MSTNTGSRAVRVVAVVMAVAMAAWAAAGFVPASAATTGQVFVVQGLPDKHVDVFVNGRKVGSSVATRTILGPLSLAAGSYQVRVTDAGSTTTILQRTVTVAAGQSVDAVVHLSAEATPSPKLTVFLNDEAAVNQGKVRLAVAHTADVPPADIRVDDKVLFSNVANGEGLTTVVPAGSYTVDVVPTGTVGPAVLGPAVFVLKSGTLTRVFAIGRPAEHTMDAIVQVLPIATSAVGDPAGINTGLGGRAATRPVSAVTRIELVVLGCALLLFAGVRTWAGVVRRSGR